MKLVTFVNWIIFQYPFKSKVYFILLLKKINTHNLTVLKYIYQCFKNTNNYG